MKLEIKDLHVSVEDTKIINGVSLTVDEGDVLAIMGPNGSGKSTLVNAVMGHPDYEITQGEVLLDGEDITDLEPDEKARKGLFLSMQYPSEVDGVTVSNFLRTALEKIKGEEMSVPDFMSMLREEMDRLDMDEEFAERYLNKDFSGGEKKRSEILQLSILKPSIAMLDETDSGLDVDGLKTIADGVNKVREEHGMGVLMVTHYQRILDYIEPDTVAVMVDGKIAETGSQELAVRVEEEGYEQFKN